MREAVERTLKDTGVACRGADVYHVAHACFPPPPADAYLCMPFFTWRTSRYTNPPLLILACPQRLIRLRTQ